MNGVGWLIEEQSENQVKSGESAGHFLCAKKEKQVASGDQRQAISDQLPYPLMNRQSHREGL
jgi:hypothetical protein